MIVIIQKYNLVHLGEEALLSPVVGGPSVTCSFYTKNNNNNNNNEEQQIIEDNNINSYFLRSKIRLYDDLSSSSTSSFNNDHEKKNPGQLISVKCKINAKKDISKYFDYPNRENNQSQNYNLKKNLFNLTGNEDALDDSVMGSNLSRHHGKGLTGRRTQSSGNLCDSKGKLSHVGKMLVPCSSSSEDRYKFSGSLPNNLDNDHDFMLVNNNNVLTDTIAGNLGGTLPHKKSSVQFNDEVTDFKQYRLQTLEGDPWEYHQNDIDIVRCKHGNLNLVRKSQHNNTEEYIPSNNQHYDSEFMGTLPKRRIDPKWCDPTSIQSIVQQYNHHEPGEIDSNYPQNVKIIHKPTCELMKHHRQQLKRLDDFNSKPTSSEHQDQGYASERSPEDEHPPLLAINPENTFQVTLQKSSRGLGLSVSGGGKSGPVRVKRLFPQQPAALSNKLEPGDILLAVNGITLTGLTNYEALEVLRTTSNTVELLVCRLPGEPSITPPKAPPTPPTRREASLPSRFLKPVPPLNIEPCGEFDIEMTKVAGSLGFTLRKVDSSALGHYVRALVREPALSDGRIQPGDKIVTVDGVPLSPMSHEEAVALLRQCGPRVKLRLYRDLTQTPVSALSPTEPDHPLRPPRTSLRKEAVDMLCDLAVRKLSPNGSNGSMSQNPTATNSSPRRLRRPASRTSMNDEKNDNNDTPSNNNLNLNQNNSQLNNSKALRPNYLNLSNGELKSEMSDDQNIETVNLLTINANDCVEIDEYYDNDTLIGDMQDSNLPLEPASMPPLAFDTDNNTSDANFSYKNPAYQSANPTCSGNDNIKSKGTYSSDKNIPGKISTVQDPAGSKSLLKWKGVMFAPDDSNENGDNTTKNDNFNGTVTKEDKYKDCEVFMVELTRGWNSRLGFSLQSHENSTIISMVHPDSVAAKDGRLRQGDVLLMVNDESVEHMPTSDIIDLLRKIRGSIGITVARQKKSGDT
ncbi:hypothetical protein KQX54_005789 [Cotesia glomerata]|uniref:PDZ domain-containing protein n=1 Tax=Cotesia glomerata TaxID=32391 RepID=A0AAV7IJR9_COTGL|nr:hypothetical protein KQX54_005789 [Cotesia glomerata]